MKTTAILTGMAIALSVAAVNCPTPVRSAIVERTQIPDHVYVEAERQMDVFVAWARNDANVPDMAPAELPAS